MNSQRAGSFETTSRYEAPQGEMETKLAAIWGKVLKKERIGRRDDFFEFGGDSIAAVQLMTKLQEIVPGETLPLRAILEAPTVEEFAVWLRENNEGNEQQVLVRVRPGSEARPAFFCVHASDGTAVGMQPLAMGCDADLPFYCLQAKGLDGAEPFATVEEGAVYCLNEIRKVQAHGPYYLGGYCFGGFIAFEMARMLEQQGEPVAALVLIDAFNPAHLRFQPTGRMLFSLLKFYVRRLGEHARKMQSLDAGEWLGYAGGRLKAMFTHARRFEARLAQVKEKQRPIELGPVEASPAASSQLDELIKRLEQVGPAAARKFEPKPYGGGALIFRVSERSDDPYEDYYLGWKPVVRGRMESFEIEATHESILVEPAVRSLAEKIDAKLRESSPQHSK